MIEVISVSFHTLEKVQEISDTLVKHDSKKKGKKQRKALDQSFSIEVHPHKYDEHFKVLNVVDSRDQFKSTMAKWKKISMKLMATKISHHHKKILLVKTNGLLYWVITA
jgi:hypothetical protein